MQLQSHPTTLKTSTAVPALVPVGDPIVVRFAVSCPDGCDLRGREVTVTGPGDMAVTGALAVYDDGRSETADITLTAPHAVGDHIFTATFAAHEAGGIRHEQCAHAITVRTEPLATSLAVWDIPSPAVMGQSFSIKVGAKSASGHALTGTTVEVCDDGGAVLAQGRFGDTPWPGTAALYWTQVQLTAPRTEAVVAWSVRFAARDLALPHTESSSQFTVAVVPPPDHRLTVRVIEKETAAAIEDVHVLVGKYRAATDQAGIADVHVPKGTYDLGIWKVGYEAEARNVVVDADLDIRIEAIVVPEEDPDAAWTA